MQLSTVDAPTLWQSTQADNLVKVQDMNTLAYFWDTLKLEKVRDITSSAGQEWAPAADLALWLLQGNASRRPKSMRDVLEHRLFNSTGQLRYFSSIDETMDAFVERQASELTALINSGNADSVKQMYDYGGVHLKMLDGSIRGSTVTPMMRAAFVGLASTVEVLLDEIDDSWPDEVRTEYLDQRTSLGFTAYMIACARGHEEVAKLFAAKGCTTSLVNTSGKNGAALLQASRNSEDHLTSESLELYLASLDRKAIVMSCPEMGTLDEDDGVARVKKGIDAKVVYDQQVMTKVSELQKMGYVKLGFDRAGTSTAREKDKALFDDAFELLDDGKREEAVRILMATDWWYGYQTSVKQAVKLESQGFDGELEIICIKGGFITQLEAAEMEQIMTEATADCLKSDINVKYTIKKVSYLQFLLEYDSGSLTPETQPSAINKSARVIADPNETSTSGDHDLRAQLTEAHAQLAAKDAELEELKAQKTAGQLELEAKDAELEQLRAQLARLEGVPPQRD